MKVTGVRCFVAALLLITAARVAGAQAVNSTPNSLTLGWNNPENINVQINFSPGVALGQFTEVGNSPTPTTTPVPLTINYNSLVNRTKLNVWAYFVDGSRALASGNGGAVPADKIQATVQGNSPATFTTASPFSASSVLLNPGGADVGTAATGTFNLAFPLGILGSGYPSGFYQGILMIQAQAI